MIRKNLPVILLIAGVIIAVILAMIFARGGSEAAGTMQPAMASADWVLGHSG